MAQLRILVAYATRKGSTAEIAEAVGRELRSAGYDVVVKEFKRVTSPEDYDAIVIGAPMYLGKAIDVGAFVASHREKLASRPVAAFVVGLAPVSKNPEMVGESLKALREALAPIQPVEATMFAGNLDPSKINVLTRHLTEFFAKTPAGDYRDWNAIATWARGLQGKLMT